MTRGNYVALLRGINVGGKNKLPMQDLVAMFTKAGCGEVRSYIQSGNVVFQSGQALAKRIPVLITQAVKRRFGYQIPVVTRTTAEIRKIVNNNPFLKSGTDPGTLHVAFLADRPGAAVVKALDPQRSPPDTFVVRGRDIYLCCPNGLARTKLSNAYFDSILTTTSTVRNWRTVLKVLELSGG